MNPAGVPMPLPNPTEIGVLKSMAEIGADPVTVRNRTPISPTDLPLSLWMSSRWATSMLSTTGSMPSWCSFIALTSPLLGFGLDPVLANLDGRDDFLGLDGCRARRLGHRRGGRIAQGFDKQLLNHAIPLRLPQPNAVGQQRARLDVGVHRPGQPI